MVPLYMTALCKKMETKMELKEINELINIRTYVAFAINFPNVNRQTCNQMNDLLLLLDKKIIAMLNDDNFKQYVGYEDIKKAKQEAIDLSNIYKGRPPL